MSVSTHIMRASMALMLIRAAEASVLPHTPEQHRLNFLHACQRGNLARVHQRLMGTYETNAQVLDAGLAVASGRGHVHVMQYLLGTGATDVELALYSAAVHDSVDACKFMTSKDREVPATDLQHALLGATQHGSLSTELHLTIQIAHPGLRELTD